MKLNKTNIRKVLSSLQYDPKKPGPLKIVLETGGEEYFLNRSIEFIKSGSPDDIKHAIILLTTVLVLQQSSDVHPPKNNSGGEKKPTVRGLADAGG